MANKKLSLQEQATEILKIAEEHGVQSNFFFVTTFKRYQVQISIMAELEAEFKKSGALVTKEYVKGRGNVYTNPAITEYNKTATAANNTVKTLIDIVEKLRPQDANEGGSLADTMAELLGND